MNKPTIKTFGFNQMKPGKYFSDQVVVIDLEHVKNKRTRQALENKKPSKSDFARGRYQSLDQDWMTPKVESFGKDHPVEVDPMSDETLVMLMKDGKTVSRLNRHFYEWAVHQWSEITWFTKGVKNPILGFVGDDLVFCSSPIL